MIVCAKCHTQFPIELNKISKDSTLPCIHCGTPCLVKLFDLQNHDTSSYGGFSEVHQSLVHPKDDNIKLESKNSVSVKKHLLIIIIILKILLIIFIIGIVEIEFLEKKFPLLGQVYQSINIFPRKTIVVSNISMEANKITDKNIAIKLHLNVENVSDKTELLSDLSVVVYDVFHNAISAFNSQPYMMIKSQTNFNFKIKIPSTSNDAKYISVYINGESQHERINISDLITQK